MRTPWIALVWLALSLVQGWSYTVNLSSGVTLAGNHRAGPDTVDTLFPASALAASSFRAWMWDQPGQTFQAVSFYNGTVWSASTPVAGGGGVLMQNASALTPTVTITGPAATAPPLNLSGSPNQFLLTAKNDDLAPATFADLLHSAGAVPSPTANTYVGRWDAAAQTWVWNKATLGVWGTTPSVPAGEAALVGEFSGLPAPVIVSARLDCTSGSPQVVVTFNREIDPVTASDVARYTFTPPLTFVSATPRYERTPMIPSVAQPYAKQVVLGGVSGFSTLAAGTYTVSASGGGGSVQGLGGAAATGSATFYTGLVPTTHSFSCSLVASSNGEPLCVTFDKVLDPTTASTPGNYTLSWSGTVAGSATANVANHVAGSTSVCLGFPSLPGGGVYSFTLTYMGLKTDCGVPSAGTFTFPGTCDPVISGRVFKHDPAGLSCGQDLAPPDPCGLPPESGVQRVTLQLRDLASGSVVRSGFTDGNGDYSVRAPAGAYTLELVPVLWTGSGPINLVPPGGPCAGSVFVRPVTLPPTGLPPNEDFPVVLPPSPADLGVWGHIMGVGAWTPCCGQQATVFVTYFNRGAVATPPTTVTVTLPGGGIATPVAGSEFPGAPALTSAPGSSTAIWNIPALAPGAHGYVSARVSLTCPIGSLNTLSASASIVTPACAGPDANPADNGHSFSAATTCSYDPNTKSVHPEGCGPFGRVLRGTEFTYRVDFQNTGSGPAAEVIICDTLDPDLDLGTVTFLGASHPAGLTVDPATRKLTFRLPAIGLPAAIHDEPGSHGYVLFRVKHLPGVANNTRITNGAAIFFDANPPILTRVTTNTVVDSLPPVGVTATVLPVTAQVGHTFTFQYSGPADATVSWAFGPDATPPAYTDPVGYITFASPGTKTATLTAAYGECLTNVTLNVNVTQSPCPGGIGAGYAVSLAAGFNFVGIQLEAGGNTLAELFPGGGGLTASEDVLQIYNPLTGTYTAYYWDGIGWVDNNLDDASGVVIPAGTGILILVSNPKTILITGCPTTTAPLRNFGRLELISSPTVGPGTMSDVLRGDPVECMAVFRINATGQFDIYRYRNGVWSPSEPVLRLGEAAFVGPETNCAPCTNELRFACAGTTNYVFTAGGTNDNFAGPEPASPSAGVVGRYSTLVGFDECPTTSAIFAHTFSNLPPCITAARVCVRLKPCDAVNCVDEAINFAWIGPASQVLPPGYWIHYFGTGNPAPGLLNSNWCTVTDGATFCLDLANLPPTFSGGPTDLIATMNQYGFLDITVGNESAVDWIQLEVESCCCHEDIEVSNDPGLCSAIVQYVPPTPIGGCGTNVTLTCTPPSGVFPVGTTTVTCIATNEAGQSATCTFRVTVRDTEPPVVICPQTLSLTNCVLPQLVVNASDNCTASNQLVFTQFPPASTVMGPGTFVVITRVCDSAGNCFDCDTTVTLAAPRDKYLTLNTGTDGAEVLLPAGAAEQRFSNIATPTGAVAMVVIDPNSSLITSGTWVNGSTRSRWVAPDVSSLGEIGWYTNRYEFNLPCTNATLLGRFAADNDGYLSLNGTLVAGPQGPASWLTINHTAGFVSGPNVLELAIYNYDGPTGYRAELDIFTECCNACVMTQTCVAAPPNPAHWYTGGSERDLVGHTPGTLEPGVTLVPGKIGYAMRFNGSSGGMNLGNVPDLDFATNDSFTIEAWFNTRGPGASGTQVIIALNYDCTPEAQVLAIDSSASSLFVRFAVRDEFNNGPVVRGSTPVTPNVWHHVAAVRDQSVSPPQLRLYVDCELVDVQTDTTTGRLARDCADLIGRRHACITENVFNGDIDEVTIYKRALTGLEIRRIAGAMQGKCRPDCAPLPPCAVALWKAEDNAKESLNKIHGKAFNGVSYVHGASSRAWNFDGINDYVSTTSSLLDVVNGLTLCAWVSGDGTPTASAVIAGRLAGYQLNLLPSRQARFVIAKGLGTFEYLDTPFTLPTNRFTFVAGTYDRSSGVMNLYVDCALVASRTLPTGTALYHRPGSPFQIGGFHDPTIPFSGGFLRGRVDDVALFSCALTPAEIGARCQAGETGWCGRSKIFIEPAGNGNLLLEWDNAAGLLQRASSPLGPWTDVSGPEGALEVAPAGASGFFRVREVDGIDPHE